ncbi:MAG: hypothetical protein EAZ77_09935 [Nostocales cyanobacterium]|nr:MAG: hypothetical protein EAZ77_09935 [Nostocales cyanobacterium]
MDLNTDRQLLKNLQEGALKLSADFSEYNETTKYWGSKLKLVELLRYPAVGSIRVKRWILTDEQQKYSFANVDVATLLQVSPADDLSSEKGIDYTRLSDLLRDGNWKEADYETYQVMLKAVSVEKAGNILAEDGSNILAEDGSNILVEDGGNFLTKEKLLDFPCIDLNTIDKLWVKYSNGQFGFSVQKEIYISVGGIVDGNYNKEAFERFGDQVGWRVDGKWIEDVLEEVSFSTSAPRGHLPSICDFGSSLDDLDLWIFYRIDTCKL